MRIPGPLLVLWRAWTTVARAVLDAVFWLLFLALYAAAIVPLRALGAGRRQSRPPGLWRPVEGQTRTLEDARSEA